MKNTATQNAVKNSQTATGEYYDGKVETIDYLEVQAVPGDGENL